MRCSGKIVEEGGIRARVAKEGGDEEKHENFFLFSFRSFIHLRIAMFGGILLCKYKILLVRETLTFSETPLFWKKKA